MKTLECVILHMQVDKYQSVQNGNQEANLKFKASYYSLCQLYLFTKTIISIKECQQTNTILMQTTLKCLLECGC